MSDKEFFAENGLIVGGNSHIRIAAGNTAQRPANPGPGTMRYNTDSDTYEAYYANGSYNALAATNLGASGSFSGTLTVGNSTVNAVTNSTSIKIGANVTVNTIGHFTGNSTVNTAVTASGFSIGANVVVNATSVGIGNSTVSVVANSTQIGVGTITINTLAIQVAGGASMNGTHFTGISLSANNATNLGGFAAAQYAFANQIVATNPGGSNTQIQFNGSGVFTGHAGLTYNFNSNTLSIGSATINSAAYSGSANNASNFNGQPASFYLTTTGLAANVATMTANNANNLATHDSSYYLNRANHTGTEAAAALSSSIGYNCSTMVASSYLYSSGNIYAVGDVYAAYSDIRLKFKIEPIWGALDIIDQLNGYTFYQNELGDEVTGRKRYGRQVGLIAQEVERVLPEAVALAGFDLDEDERSKSGEDYLTVSPEKLIPVLIEAIKELKRRIVVLEAN